MEYRLNCIDLCTAPDNLGWIPPTLIAAMFLFFAVVCGMLMFKVLNYAYNQH